tara:strand:+ start:1142 stop:1594 length:453 start_codon:yes stop_codon:yes gene_type:complete
MKSRNKLFLVAIVISFAIGLFVIYPDSKKDVFDKAILITKIEKEAGIIIPAGSTLINFKEDTESSIDPTWIAKIKIPTNTVERVKEQIIAYKESNPLVSGYRLSTSVKWWSPQNSFFSRYYLKNNPSALIYIVFSKDKKNTIMYIEYIMF